MLLGTELTRTPARLVLIDHIRVEAKDQRIVRKRFYPLKFAFIFVFWLLSVLVRGPFLRFSISHFVCVPACFLPRVNMHGCCPVVSDSMCTLK